MQLKICDITMQNPEATEAETIECIKIYEKVANKYLENKLTAPSARDLFFRSCLLLLVLDDTVGAENNLEKYCDLDPSLTGTREFKFIK